VFPGTSATVASSVAERRREVAVRIAHGRRTNDIARLLAAEGLWEGALGPALADHGVSGS